MRKLIKKITAMVLVTTLLLTGCGNSEGTNDSSASQSSESSKEELTTIRLGIQSSSITQFMAVVDDHTGIYEKHGINLETTEFAMGINAVDSIVSEQLDIAHIAEYAGVNRIGNTSDQTDLRFFTTFGQSDQYELYVNPEKVSEVSDIEGQSVATIVGTVYDYWFAKLFEYGDIDSSKVDIQPVTSAQEALALAESDSIVAYWVTAKQQKDLFAERGWKPLITNGEIDADCIQILVAKDGFLNENQDAMVDFLKATNETIQYINDNFDEVAGWVNDDLGLDQTSLESSLEYDFSFGFPEETYTKVQEVNIWCKAHGNYGADYDVADFLNLDVLKKYDENADIYSK